VRDESLCAGCRATFSRLRPRSSRSCFLKLGGIGKRERKKDESCGGGVEKKVRRVCGALERPRGDLRRTSANGPESQRKSHDARADDAATCTHQQQQEKGRKRRQCTTRRPLPATTATKQLCPGLAIPVPFVPSFAIFDVIFGIFVTAFRRPLQRFRLRAPLRLCPHLRRWCLTQPFVVGCAGIPPLLAHFSGADGHYFHSAAARR
jgi:hypothetical protein